MNKVREAFPEFEKPSVAIDTVIMRVNNTDEVDNKSISNKQLQVLLVKRTGDKDWHLPGTILRLGETPRDAIRRIADNKVNAGDVVFEQLYTVADDPMRDERGHIISIVYIGMIPSDTIVQVGESYEYKWFWVSKQNTNNKFRVYTSEDGIDSFMYMMYDHDKIVNDTINRLKGKLLYTDVGFNFIGKLFTIKELENTFSAINERTIPGFRRIIGNKVIGTGKMSDGKAFRPAELFMKKE